MAEESIKASEIVDFEGYKKELKEVITITEKLKQESITALKQINTTLNANRGDSTKEIDATTEALKRSTQQRRILAEAEEAEYKAQLALNNATKAELQLKVAEQREIDKSAKAKKAELKALQDQASAYKQASARLNELRNKYKDLAVASGGSAKELKELGREIGNLDKELKSIDAEVGQFQRNVGNYEGALNAATASTGEFGTAIGSIKGGLEAAKQTFNSAVGDIRNLVSEFRNAEGGVEKTKKAFNLFNNALKVSVIAVVIAALASLAAYFKTTEEGGDQLGRSIAQLKAVFGVLVRDLAKAAPFIFGFFKDLYKVGASAVIGLQIGFQKLKLSILEVANALPSVDLSDQINETTKAVKDLNKEYDDLGEIEFAKNAQGVADAFSGITEEIADATEKAGIIFDLFDELEEKQIRYAQQLQKLTEAETRYSAISADTTESFRKREKAQADLEKASLKRATLERDIAKEEFEINLRKTALDSGFTTQFVLNTLKQGKAQGALTTDLLKGLNEYYLKAEGAENNLLQTKEDVERSERELQQRKLLTTEKILQESVETELAAIKNVADSSKNSFEVRQAAIDDFAKKNAEAFAEEVAIINKANKGVIDANKLRELSGTALEEYINSLGIQGDKVTKELSDIANKEKKNTAELLASKEKYADDLEKIRIRNANAQNKIEQEDFKRSVELQDQLTQKLKEQLSRRAIDSINASYNIQAEALTEQAEFELKNAELTAKERLAIEEKLQRDLARLEDKRKDDVDKTNREILLKRLEGIQKITSAVISETQKELDAISEKRLSAIDKEIEQRNANIEIAQRRFEAGLENQLAFEKQKLAESELARRDAEKRAQQQREALQLVEITLQAYIARLKEPNANAGTALAKAFSDTLLAKAGAKLIAGSFFEGSELVEKDLKGNKVHNGRDGYLVAIDGKERVLTGEQNAMIPQWMNNDMLSKVAYDWSRGNLGTAQNIMYSVAFQPELLEEVKGLRKDIRNMPVGHTSMDEFGRIVETVITGSLKKVTRQNKIKW